MDGSSIGSSSDPPFSIMQATVLQFGEKKWVLDTQEVNDVKFVCLTKWCRHFVQFATGQALDMRASKRVTGNKQFFDQLVKERRLASVAAITNTLHANGDGDDQSHGRKNKKRKFSKADLLSSSMIAPSMVDVTIHGHTMKALFELRSINQVWIELTMDNMKFVRAGMMQSAGEGRSWKNNKHDDDANDDESDHGIVAHHQHLDNHEDARNDYQSAK